MVYFFMKKIIPVQLLSKLEKMQQKEKKALNGISLDISLYHNF